MEQTSFTPSDKDKEQAHKEGEQETKQETTKETQKEIHHHHYGKGKGFNLGSMFLGLVLLIVGVIYLLSNTGVLNVDIDFDFSVLWPLIIVFIGLAILTGRGWLSGIIGAVVIVGVLFLIVAMVTGWIDTPTREVTTDTISIEEEADIESASLSIATGAGNLTVAGGSEKLISGKLEANFLELTTSSKVVDSVQKVKLEMEDIRPSFFGKKVNNLDVLLDSKTPVELDIDTGAMDMDFDFTEVMLTTLDVDTGASDLHIIMGDLLDESTIAVDAGASSINITLPKTVGAMIDIDAGVTSKNFTDFDKIDDQTYKSENYDDTEKKVNIELNLGAADVDVVWAE
ncbi:toast rack family protein [Patescibacteria group bacterium]